MARTARKVRTSSSGVVPRVVATAAAKEVQKASAKKKREAKEAQKASAKKKREGKEAQKASEKQARDEQKQKKKKEKKKKAQLFSKSEFR